MPLIYRNIRFLLSWLVISMTIVGCSSTSPQGKNAPLPQEIISKGDSCIHISWEDAADTSLDNQGIPAQANALILIGSKNGHARVEETDNILTLFGLTNEQGAVANIDSGYVARYSEFRWFKKTPSNEYQIRYSITNQPLRLDLSATHNFDTIFVQHIVAKDLFLESNHDQFLDLNDTLDKIENIYVGDTYYSSGDLPQFSLARFYDQDIDGHEYIGGNYNNLLVRLRKLGLIQADTVHYLGFTNCTASKNTRIDCNVIDTLCIDTLTAIDKQTSIHLTTLSAKTMTLLLRNVDVTQMDLNYSKFHFAYFPADSYPSDDAWRSDVRKIYLGLIETQKRAGNQQGLKDASIQLGAFEDKQTIFGPIIGDWISHLKMWWNGYGFEKDKVIESSTIVFFIFALINFFLFKEILESYCFPSIKEAREKALATKNKFYFVIYDFILCLVYSGFIFYGLKIDFDKLKFKNVAFVLWLLFQYIVGIVSLAYLANLILNK